MSIIDQQYHAGYLVSHAHRVLHEGHGRHAPTHHELLLQRTDFIHRLVDLLQARLVAVVSAAASSGQAPLVPQLPPLFHHRRLLVEFLSDMI